MWQDFNEHCHFCLSQSAVPPRHTIGGEEETMPSLLTNERPVTDVPAASPGDARAHFEWLLAYETDCWDVHTAIAAGHDGFVVLDVRSPEAYAAGHVPGAISLPHRRITKAALDAYPKDLLFVVYCSGPHCNGADRAALRVARIGRPVKKMIGGISGWREEGFALDSETT
jgi:rhodanese-related sulfurtransferase